MSSVESRVGDGHASDCVLVVGQRVDGRRIIAAKVSEFPAPRNRVAVEQRWIGNDIVDAPDVARAQRVDKCCEYRFAIERPPPAQGRIGAAANHHVAAVEPKLGRELVIEAKAVDRRRGGEEFAVRRRHQQCVRVPRIQHAAGIVLNIDPPDCAAQLGNGRRPVDSGGQRCASRQDEAKRKKNLQMTKHDRGCTSRLR